MSIKSAYQNNRPLINAVFTGLFYFLFSWSIEYGEGTKGAFMSLMLFLPGITFPLTTCSSLYQHYKTSERRKILHVTLSVAIYYGSVWLFSGQGFLEYITILAGFSGSFLFQLTTKFLLKAGTRILDIVLTAALSGLAFWPYVKLLNSGLAIGIAVFLWTIINGYLLNHEYKRVIQE